MASKIDYTSKEYLDALPDGRALNIVEAFVDGVRDSHKYHGGAPDTKVTFAPHMLARLFEIAQIPVPCEIVTEPVSKQDSTLSIERADELIARGYEKLGFTN